MMQIQLKQQEQLMNKANDAVKYLNNLEKEDDDELNNTTISLIPYDGWSRWAIIARVLKNREFSPGKLFPQIIKEELETDDISKFEIINHNIILLDSGSYWIHITVGIEKNYKKKEI